MARPFYGEEWEDPDLQFLLASTFVDEGQRYTVIIENAFPIIFILKDVNVPSLAQDSATLARAFSSVSH